MGCLLLQALCALIAIAMVHSDTRLTCAIPVALFATGIALSALLIAAYGRPFTGDIWVAGTPHRSFQTRPSQPEIYSETQMSDVENEMEVLQRESAAKTRQIALWQSSSTLATLMPWRLPTMLGCEPTWRN